MSYRREDNYHPMRYHEPPPPPLHYGPAFHPGYRYDHIRESPWGISAPNHYRPSEHSQVPMPFTNYPPPTYYKDIPSGLSSQNHQHHLNYHRNPNHNQYQHSQNHSHLPTTSSNNSNYQNIPNLIPIIQGFRPDYSAHHNLFEYQNTQPQPAHLAPTLRHILTHYQPPNRNNNSQQRMREEEKTKVEEKSSRNPRKPPVPRKKCLQKPTIYCSDQDLEIVDKGLGEKREENLKQKEKNPKRNRIVWKKKRQVAPVPTGSFSSSEEFEVPKPTQNESPKELDLSLKKRPPKRKSDGNHPEVGKVKVNAQNSVPAKTVKLLSQDHENKDWIKKGTVVKSIQHDRPMGTVIGVSKDRNICTLQFFSGWKAEIQTKFVTQVLSEESEIA